MQATASRAIDRTVKIVLSICVTFTIFISLIVIFILGRESIDFFQRVSLFDFIFGLRWEPLLEPKSFGVLPLVLGTLMIVLGSVLLALPAGVIIATYLNEFASNRVRAIVKPILEILAGIPTVVYGFFALTFITPGLKLIIPSIEVFNALSAAIVVGIMILPMVASIVDDGFRSLPTSLREGAYGLGATPFEVITQIVIPASASRIGAAVVLAVSRAIGETMAVSLAAGATPKITLNPLESIQTMTGYIVQVSLGDTPQGGVEYLTCFSVGALLFVMTFVMNMIGNYYISKVKWDLG